MTTKNVLYYIGIVLIGFILRVLSAIFYGIPFSFRNRVLIWCRTRFFENTKKRFEMRKNYKRWKLYFHPYLWMFWFTTGLEGNYSGDSWYKEDLKLKWKMDTIRDKYNLLYRLRYFWICYCWQGWRNANGAFYEWFFREGTYKEKELVVTNSDAPYGLAELIMPELKWDKGNDGGKEIRYFYEADGPDDEWRTTHEGRKTMEFTTDKGNRRFYTGYCKIIPLYTINRFLAIQRSFGWNWWNGMIVLSNKHILLKMNENSLAKYNKYIALLKEIKN